MTDQDVVQQAKEAVAAWRKLEALRRGFSTLIKDWDSLLEESKEKGEGFSPQIMRRTFIKDIRASEFIFRNAMKALGKATG